MEYNFSVTWNSLSKKVKEPASPEEEAVNTFIIIEAFCESSLKEALLTIFNPCFSKKFFIVLKGGYTKYNLENQKKWFHSLSLLLTHHLYEETDNVKPICLIKDSNGTILKESSEKILDNELNMQGFRNVRCINLEAGHSSLPYLPFYLLKEETIQSSDLFHSFYLETITSTSSKIHLLINGEKINNILINKYIIESENNLAEKNKHLSNSIRERNQNRELANKLIKQKSILEEDLNSKKEYMNFLLGKYNRKDISSGITMNEVQKIKLFYHYEYEILPMWFKRMGHLLKVIYGKRSFKSLFNDKTEKYKS